MIKPFFLSLVIVFAVSSMAQTSLDKTSDIGKLHDLDLLFVVASHPNAITAVTSGFDGNTIDHVGVVFIEHGRALVVESVYEGVRERPLSDFLQANSMVLVGRISKRFDRDHTSANIKSMLGRPYDFVFSQGSDAIYCSELVTECFVDKNGNKLFPSIPMSFRDESGEVTSYWVDFYSQRGMDVPEGEPGSNPGELSRRSIVKIKYKLGNFVK